MTVAVAPPPAVSPVLAEPCLSVRGLTKRYGGLVAVKNIDLDLRPGEILGLIGPNGSGKSTVMKLIMGLERPSAGSIRLDGQEIGGMPAHRVARSGIGLVFQHARPLQRQTVLENISLALLPDSLIRLAADPHVARRAKKSPSASASAPSPIGAPAPCPSPTCAGWSSPRPSPAIPGWCWSASPSRA